jgi:cytochrome c551/c552
MNRGFPAPLALPALLALLLAGCGGGQGAGSGSGSVGVEETSPLDVGPRAGDAPVAAALAAQGEGIFKAKGCTACHAYGKRLTGPDLKGVTRRRTAQWMEKQILHPEVMVKEDPIARKMLAEYNLQMANQGLTLEEAKSVIEYFKKLDEEAEAKGELAAQN